MNPIYRLYDALVRFYATTNSRNHRKISFVSRDDRFRCGIVRHCNVGRSVYPRRGFFEGHELQLDQITLGIYGIHRVVGRKIEMGYPSNFLGPQHTRRIPKDPNLSFDNGDRNIQKAIDLDARSLFRERYVAKLWWPIPAALLTGEMIGRT